jgi:hypothetical protein
MRDEDRLVTVYETTRPTEVALVKAAFQDAGIPFSVVNEIMSSILPFDGTAIVGFQVFERDAQRALKALAQMRSRED